MNPALYQHWKRQQTERLRRDRLMAARRASVVAPSLILEPAPPKKRRPE